MKLIDRLQESIAKVRRVPEGQAEPVAIIWTDATGEWSALAPLLTLLKTAEDVRLWAARQEKTLLAAINDGPVQVE
jgi:hypothetical protein